MLLLLLLLLLLLGELPGIDEEDGPKRKKYNL
jgi:hypothetical protein